MTIPLITTGKMIDSLKKDEKAVAIEGDNKGAEVFYQNEGGSLVLWVKHSEKNPLVTNESYPLQIKDYHKNTRWRIIPKYHFVSVSEAIDLYKLGSDTDWIAVIREGAEIFRFRNKSMWFVEVIENGAINDVKKTDFSLSAYDIEKSEWALIHEVEDEDD